MNTKPLEVNKNLMIAEGYYSAILAKDFNKVATYLDDKVQLISPLAEIHGKEAVISAAKNLSLVLSDIKIRAKFTHQNQIMLAYDFMFPAPLGTLRSAVLMEFANQLISKIELFYDGRPFAEKKDEIFEK